VIIPFLEDHPLRSKKKNDYKYWKEAALIVRSKYHLTKQGRKDVIELKKQMEEGRTCEEK
jgi:hypothetical protein